MKLLVIGNCQARPVAQILARTPDVTLLEPIILHLAQPDQAEDHRARLAQADLILTQFTAAAFQPVHLASATVVREWPGKVLVWPNLFYAGQQPFLRYLTQPGYGRLMGPFDAVHDIRLLRDWHTGRSGQAMVDIDTKEYAAAVHAASLAELQRREATCDVTISDLIAAHHTDRPLFYTFNHPARWLLEALCDRIAAAAALSLPATQERHEFLDAVIVPSTWGPRDAVFKGRQVALQPDGTVLAQGQHRYTYESLRETSFRCYDHMAPHVDFETLRHTPKLDIGPGTQASDPA